MQSAALSELSVNIENVPEAWRDSCLPQFDGGRVVGWVLPIGFVFEGEQAVLRVKTGQAAPVDAECAAACEMTASQLASAQRRYQSAVAGIKGKKDHELFMAGVIDGYDEGTTDAKPIYIPGRNWQVFQVAKAQADQKQQADI